VRERERKIYLRKPLPAFKCKMFISKLFTKLLCTRVPQNDILIYIQQDAVRFIWKLLYMFWVVPPAIIRSANNCIYSIWYLSDRYCYLPLIWKLLYMFWVVPPAIIKSANNCIYSIWYLSHRYFYLLLALHLVGYILEYSYDARTHER
jgi:hypothetical protein